MTRLQQLRKENNLSQSELAKLSGVNFRTLQDFDQGRKKLSNAKGEMIYRLSLALNCSSDELLEGEMLESGALGDEDNLQALIFSHNEETHRLKQLSRINAYSERIQSVNMNLYSEYYRFPVIEPCAPVRMEYIHPIKQKLIATLHRTLSPMKEITSVMLFGSSISMRCTFDSDTDLAVRLDTESVTVDNQNSVSEIIQEICDWKADILWYDRLSENDRVYRDICRGVQIV